MLLPAATIAFLTVHLYLIQRHGVAGPPREITGAPRPFYPFHVVKDLAACLVVFIALLGLAATCGAPLEGVADPADTTYLPRPEWYFLFLYELLKFFRGGAMVVGTILLPLAGLTLLFLLPLLDRSPERAIRRRPLALAGGVSLVAGLLYLTVVAMSSTPRPGVFLATPGPLTPKHLAGMSLFEEKGCPSCHSVLGKGMKLAPDLYRVGAKRDAQWMSKLLTDPQSVFSAPSMVQYTLAAKDLEALVAYLDSLDLTQGVQKIPPLIVAGGAAVYRHGCLACHRVSEEGKEGGLALEHVRGKMDEARLTDYLRGDGGHPAIPSLPSEKDIPSIMAYIWSL